MADRRAIPTPAGTFEALAAGPEDGRPVLLLHDFPESAEQWEQQLAALAYAGHRAVAFDQRGYSPGVRPGRSQMAEALFNRLAPGDMRAESAGQQPRAEGVSPAVVEVLREVGIDISAKRPKKLRTEMQVHADWAITLACGAACPYVPTFVEDWDIPDPAGKSLE
jgi:hypothetical protein